jgi:hypothetical protein
MADINIDELNDSIDRLNRTLNSLSTNLADFGQVSIKTTGSVKAQGAAGQTAGQAIDGLTRSARGLTEAELARLEAQKKLRESEMHLKDASDKAKQALGSFGGALLDQSINITKFGGAISSVGDAALSVGKALGGWALLIGGLTKGLTVLLEAQLKITQSYLDGKNELNKMGAAGAHTTESLRKMARDADLNAETLGRMIKPMKGLGSDIMILGNNAGAAQKEFAQLVKATSEERAEMMRLGISQEEMMQGTADYLALQAASGRSIKGELQDREKLRRASIDYQTSLMDLASLTGKDVASLKEKQKENALDAQRQVKLMADQIKIDDLTKAGRLDEAAAVRREMEQREKALDALADAPEALRKGAKEMLITGTISGEESRKLARNNMQGPMAEFANSLKEGKDAQLATAKVEQDYYAEQKNRLRSSERALLVSEQARKDFDFNNVEDNKKRSQRMNQNLEQDLIDIRAGRKKAQQPGQDAPADAQAKIQEATIKASGAVEDVAMKLPIMATAALAAAGALGMLVLAAKKASAGGVMDKIKGIMPFGGGAGGGLPGTGGVVPGGASGIPNVSPASAGAAGNAGKAAGALGAGGGNILEGAAKGLKAFANPMVLAGAAGFGVAIAAVGAGLAGATWIMGKALPSLAEGLQPFEKLDGSKLVDSGKGIAAIGGGLAVFGAGGAAAGIGGIIGGLSDKLGNFLGVDGPMKKLEEFDKLKIDGDRVKKNAEAFMAFNKAFAVGGGASAVGGMGNLIGGFTDKISSRLGIEGPFKKLQEFGELKINSANVKNNAEAMASFGDAMSKYKGTDQGMWGTLSEGVASFFQIDAPYNKMEKFAKIDLGSDGAKRVKTNAQAFVYFSQALAEFKGGGELANAADNIVGGIVKMFGGDDVMGKFVKFTKLDVDPDRALKLGQAFAAYSSAMSGTAGGGTAAPQAKPVKPGATTGGGTGGGGGGSGSKPAAAVGGGGGGVSVPSTPSGGGVMDWASGWASKLLGGGSKDSEKVPSDDAEGKVGGGGGGPAGPLKMGAADAGDAAKGPRKKTDGIIVHHTGGRGLQSAISTLKARGLGYHYMVDQDGSITEFVPGDQKAWHAGKTDKQPGLTNSNSVSISLVAKDDSDVSTAQLKSGFDLGKSLMSKFGASMVFGHGETSSHKQATEGKTLAEALRSGKIPTKVSADAGGLAMGPETGYPATLHGNEMIVPLDPNSFLAELGKKTNTEIQAQMQDKAAAMGSKDPEAFKELVAINQSMMEMMSNKLDSVINRLETSNSTQDKLLKYSQA